MLNDFDEWLDWGMTKGWIGDVTCVMHDGITMEPSEDNKVVDGFDPCVFIVRISEDILDTRR